MNQSRRNFVQVMAFVGAAMATPKLMKAADLPVVKCDVELR